MTRKLVYIAYTFPPVSTGSAPMNLKLSNLFIGNGWIPHVVTPRVHGGLPLDPSLERLLPEQVRVVRTGSGGARVPSPVNGTASRGPRSALRGRLRKLILQVLLQPDRYVVWLPAAVAAGTRELLRSRAEVIITLGPPHSVHLAGLACSLLTGRPWVACFGDLWVMDGNVDWDSLPESRLLCSRAAEEMVVRSADGIITTTEGSSDYFRDTYGEDCPPVQTLWNGVTRHERQALWNPSVVPELTDELIVTYTGFFMGNQSPEYFLAGMRLYLDRHPHRKVRFRVVGEMGNYSGLPMEMGLEGSVDLIGKVPYGEVQGWQRSSHLLLLMLPPQQGSELKNPAKTAEYLLARRPILAVAGEGDMTGLVRGLDAGYTSDHSPESICNALERAFDDLAEGRHRVLRDQSDLDGRMDMESNGRDMVRFLERIVVR